MVIIWSIIGVLVLVAIISAAWAGLRAAPWVPTWAKDFARIRELAQVQSGDTILELGAGEGRVLRAFVETPAQTIIGYEISYIPFLIATLRLRKYRPRVRVLCKDFFHASFTDASVIFCFLTPPAMRKLKVKCEAECRPGTRILSYAFSVPGWKADRVDKPTPNAMTIYRYVVGTLDAPESQVLG